jgi:glycosyltransferase involved in cell wall biosynthesis
MRTLAALSTLPREGPSVRPRVLAYEDALRQAGIELRFSPFFGAKAFAGFYSTSRASRALKVLRGLGAYSRRSRELDGAREADGVLVHREIVPRGNRRALRRLAGRPLAYDLDDAIYLSPRDYVDPRTLSSKRMSRCKDPAEVDALIAAADIVLAGNETIAEHAGRACDDVRVVPTAVDTETFRPRPKTPRDRPLVGWIGSPTATYCLTAILPALARAAREAPFDLLVVGAGERIEVEGVRVVNRDWSLSSEADDFASLDVGLYPLPDNEWTRAKCGMKTLLYMASGVPAIVSPVGVNRDMVRDGATGFLAGAGGDWTDRLLLYLRDPDLREAHGREGREAAAEWSLDAIAPRFVAAVEDLIA